MSVDTNCLGERVQRGSSLASTPSTTTSTLAAVMTTTTTLDTRVTSTETGKQRAQGPEATTHSTNDGPNEIYINGQSSMVPDETPHEEKLFPPNTVLLNIYDIAWANNLLLYPIFGCGIHHSGVHVLQNDAEFCYGRTTPGQTGIVGIEPRTFCPHLFRQSLVVGQTPLSINEVNDLIDHLSRRKEWQSESYHLVRHNCNVFSNILVRLLLDPFCIKVFLKSSNVAVGSSVFEHVVNQEKQLRLQWNSTKNDETQPPWLMSSSSSVSLQTKQQHSKRAASVDRRQQQKDEEKKKLLAENDITAISANPSDPSSAPGTKSTQKTSTITVTTTKKNFNCYYVPFDEFLSTDTSLSDDNARAKRKERITETFVDGHYIDSSSMSSFRKILMERFGVSYNNNSSSEGGRQSGISHREGSAGHSYLLSERFLHVPWFEDVNPLSFAHESKTAASSTAESALAPEQPSYNVTPKATSATPTLSPPNTPLPQSNALKQSQKTVDITRLEEVYRLRDHGRGAPAWLNRLARGLQLLFPASFIDYLDNIDGGGSSALSPSDSMTSEDSWQDVWCQLKVSTSRFLGFLWDAVRTQLPAWCARDPICYQRYAAGKDWDHGFVPEQRQGWVIRICEKHSSANDTMLVVKSLQPSVFALVIARGRETVTAIIHLYIVIWFYIATSFDHPLLFCSGVSNVSCIICVRNGYSAYLYARSKVFVFWTRSVVI